MVTFLDPNVTNRLLAGYGPAPKDLAPQTEPSYLTVQKLRIIVDTHRNRAVIVVCRSVGAVPDIMGLVWPSLRPKSSSKSKVSGRILKSYRGSFSSAEIFRAGWAEHRPEIGPSGPRALHYAIVFPGRKSGFRAGMWPGRLQNRPSGQPSAGRRADSECFTIRIRPKSGPEVRFPARSRHCVT